MTAKVLPVRGGDLGPNVASSKEACGVLIPTPGDSGDAELERKLAWIFREYIRDIWVHKQKAYGPSNITSLGLAGILVRSLDKFNRLKTFILDNGPNNAPADMTKEEWVEDALLDLMGYMAMGLLVYRGLWPEPVPWYTWQTVADMMSQLMQDANEKKGLPPDLDIDWTGAWGLGVAAQTFLKSYTQEVNEDGVT